MNQGIFRFNDQQRALILKMEVPEMIELFEVTNRNVADFLRALNKQPKTVWISSKAFELSESKEELAICIQDNVLSVEQEQRKSPLPENYRILGIYLSEHLEKNPFAFLTKPEKNKPKITIIDLFFEMSLSEIGKTPVQEVLHAEIIPPRKERALRKAMERSKTRRRYTVAEIFTKMPLSRVGNLTLSEFLGAEVWAKKPGK